VVDLWSTKKQNCIRGVGWHPAQICNFFGAFSAV